MELVQMFLNEASKVSFTVSYGMFVQGPTDSKQPCGLGQQAHDQGGHTWIHIEGVGHVDLSPKFDDQFASWRPLRSSGIVASSWTGPPNTGLVMRTSTGEYDQAIALAVRARDRLHAIYYVADDEALTGEIAENGLSWANSPLTDQLLKLALPSDAYQRLARHLAEVACGSRSPINEQTPAEAWARVIGLASG